MGTRQRQGSQEIHPTCFVDGTQLFAENQLVVQSFRFDHGISRQLRSLSKSSAYSHQSACIIMYLSPASSVGTRQRLREQAARSCKDEGTGAAMICSLGFG